MSARLDPTWKVVTSPSTAAVDRCVDIFSRPDGTFGFEEFRRDPEDMGAWTPVAYYSGREFQSEADALAAARGAVPWLAAVLDGSRAAARGGVSSVPQSERQADARTEDRVSPPGKPVEHRRSEDTVEPTD
jgi:hypothetical protein